jgi:hypothetical protein
MMKMNLKKRLGMFPAIGLSSFFLLATTARAGEIQKRRENQQDRIAAGIQSGQLTPREAAQLERKESILNREQRDMRRDNGGTLTVRDRRQLNRQQNRLSRDIYRQKHDRQRQLR